MRLADWDDGSLQSARLEGVLGGKAGALAKLSRYFRVPDFFVLIPDDLNDFDVDATLLEKISRSFQGAPVAVRSSANVEDGRLNSYAGVFQTLLGVASEPSAVRAAVREVVLSARGDRVRAYADLAQINPIVRMSVIVQRMLDAASAGVSLTCGPASERILIEAVLGLGDVLVSGLVDPDRYSVDRIEETVVIEHVSHQSSALCLAPSGGLVTRPIPHLDRNCPKLSIEEVRGVADLAVSVETLFGGQPSDIEWAIEKDVLYLLQARPYAAHIRTTGWTEA